jgi:phosphatidylserine/phosphatidylglycerophosphate/cardiolipin synthase-like enzyme
VGLQRGNAFGFSLSYRAELLDPLHMRRGTTATAVLIFCFLFPLPAAQTGTPQVEVFFSPGGDCTKAIVSSLGAAKTSVYVQAYSFTSAPIAEALGKAHRRGVRVSVLLDDSQRGDKYSSADFLNNAGIAPQIDAKHAIAHNKVMIIDERIVITGSFNFTKAAEERNAENLLVITDKILAAKYLANWQKHAAHAETYVRSVKTAKPTKPKDDGSILDGKTWRRFFDKLTK